MNQRGLVLFLLTVFSATGLQPAAASFDIAGNLPPTPAKAQATSEQIEVPMRLVDGMPAVEVFVNGQGPFVFRIDTGGAGQARVDAALVQQLRLPQTGEIRGSAGGAGAAVAMALIRLDSLKLGALEFENVEAPSRNYNDRGGERIDGILCFNLFAGYLLTLDYPARKVLLRRGELPAADGKRILPFEMPNQIPEIKIDLAGTAVKARLDSGNMAAGFMLTQGQMNSLKLSGEPRVIGRGRTLSGDFEIKEASLAGEIRIGAYRFSEPVVRFAPVFREANVGAAVLREFVVTFDQKNQRMKWERANEQVTIIQSSPPRAAPGLAVLDPQAYAGAYGPRTITVEEGQLFLQKTGGPKLKLIKLSEDEFGLEQISEARIKFGRDAQGKVSEIKVRNPAGEWETAPKSN